MRLTIHAFRSYVYVGIQFVCLALLIATGPWIASSLEFLVLEMLGIFFGFWALLTMKLRNLSVLPEIKPNSFLQTGGPYRWVRHPMYSALLLVMLVLVLEEFTYWRGLVWLILSLDLFLKLQYEEELLVNRFPEYRGYQSKTSKLIPWIW